MTIVKKEKRQLLAQPRQLYLKTELAGERFIDHYEEKRARIGRNSKLFLKREPENRYDSDAISVRTRNGIHLGYIPRRVNRRLASEMDQGEVKFSVELSGDDKGSGALIIDVYSFAKPSKKKELKRQKPFIESCAELGFSKDEILILRTLSWPEIKTPYLPQPPSDELQIYASCMNYYWGRNSHLDSVTGRHDWFLKSLINAKLIHCQCGDLPSLSDIEHILGSKRNFNGAHASRCAIRDLEPFEKLVRSLGYGHEYFNARNGAIKRKSFTDFLRVAPAKYPREGCLSIQEWYSGKTGHCRKSFFDMFDSLDLFFLPYWKDESSKTLLDWYEGRNLSAIVAFEYLLERCQKG